MSDVICDYGDARRAAALLVHYAQEHMPGVDAVVEETAQEGRSLELLAAVLNLVFKVAPDLRTEDSIGRLQNIALTMAGGEQ